LYILTNFSIFFLNYLKNFREFSILTFQKYQVDLIFYKKATSKLMIRSNFYRKYLSRIDGQIIFNNIEKVSQKKILKKHIWLKNEYILLPAQNLTRTFINILILLLKYFVTIVTVPSQVRIVFRIGVDIKYHWIQI